MAMAQVRDIQPKVLTKSVPEERVTEVEVAAHFVTAIRMPEPVNSVVVGDPELFQVEHSDKEPRLVFIKAVTTKQASHTFGEMKAPPPGGCGGVGRGRLTPRA